MSYKTFKGDQGKHGVCDGNAVLYDALFTYKTAQKIAALYNKSRNRAALTWTTVKEILVQDGYPV